MPRRINPPALLVRLGAALLAIALAAGCSSNPVDTAPPTIDPARAADSPPVTTAPPGVVHPLAGAAQAAVFDEASGSLVVLGSDAAGRSIVNVVSPTGAGAPVDLEGAATAIAGNGDGEVFLATVGGYFRFDVASRAATRIEVAGQDGVEFTAVARRADGNLVLGSADGAVYTLDSETTVSAQLKTFARVDSLVTQGNTAVVLDRGQTSVTSLNPEGTKAEHALRAGQGATTMAADPAGRVLVTDTRGGELLVYGVDPLILRQRFPVPDSPYGLAASGDDTGLAWVAQTATNTVVGYDLATGIPVEKVRYRTVRQPNSLAFDDASGTLYVVSGAGAGVQVIASAGADK
ncbi:YncE family protein [Mycolicibacterium sp. CR10]|uniref:YncE family protein n=1 Tax=Mycolicibacterium sp. CR10 TaxID=2562314 RepID=UPI0010C0B65D|nr:SMP-30/gluconolactonase/LRE family protein [Mycolicibacterium sp. CR10]